MKYNEAKQLLEDNLNFLQSLSVPEYTLYRKGAYMNTKKMFDGYYSNKVRVSELKNKIGVPKDKNDYQDLNICVIPVDESNIDTGRTLREMIHTATGSQSPGRNLKFLVVNKKSYKNLLGMEQIKYEYLGIISLGSDFIGGRDNKIGGTSEHKLDYGMLKHTCMGSTIVPTQPLGYYYLGGKLISLMTCSEVIENEGNKRYDEQLTGITTTSLYGGFSQYNNLKHGIKCKSSEGKIDIEPTDDVYFKLREGFRNSHKDEYNKIFSKEGFDSGHQKSKLMSKIYNKLDVKPRVNNAPRGVYWCPLFNNTNEFLRCEHDRVGDKRFDNSIDSLSDLGKEKYAKKRIDKFEDVDNKEPLYYDDLINRNWKYVKSKYLNDVGR